MAQNRYVFAQRDVDDFSCIKTLVLSVENQVCLSVKTDQKEYFGHYVFDSRPKKIREPFQKKYSISQSFYGLKIKLKRRSFEDRVYRMMDFRVSQAKATQFVYILPYSKDTALIELTRFGKDILQINEAENILNKFIECNFGEYTVVGKERGIIPMTPVSPRGNTKANVINIGTRGGNVKPSTGYAFKNMYDQSRLICNSVSFKNKSLSKKNRFLFYDQLLLIILTRWPEKGRFIFERLFKTNSPVFVLNFLDEKTKFFGELMEFYTIFHKKLYETEDTPLHDPCVIAYLLEPNIFKGRLVNVIVEENSELTRGETIVDWLGVTKRKPNCMVMNYANDKKFFDLLKNKLSKLP